MSTFIANEPNCYTTRHTAIYPFTHSSHFADVTLIFFSFLQLSSASSSQRVNAWVFLSVQIPFLVQCRATLNSRYSLHCRSFLLLGWTANLRRQLHTEHIIFQLTRSIKQASFPIFWRPISRSLVIESFSLMPPTAYRRNYL